MKAQEIRHKVKDDKNSGIEFWNSTEREKKRTEKYLGIEFWNSTDNEEKGAEIYKVKKRRNKLGIYEKKKIDPKRNNLITKLTTKRITETDKELKRKT